MNIESPVPYPDLAAAVPPLLAALSTPGGCAVLTAPPGAGKSTSLPLALLGEPWAASGRIVMLQPRRLATRAVAERMAELLGEALGRTVGYRMRFESRTSASTRLEVMTEGTLTARLQRDPALEGVTAVLFDEWHERSVHTDLSLALTLDAREGLRPDLRILAMSATLPGDRLAPMLGGPLIVAEGRRFDVDTRHAGGGLDGVTNAVRTALIDTPGDVLVFLPGAREIGDAERRLRTERWCAGVLVLPLFGALSGQQQARVLRPDPDGRRRIVLATNIAETSLTIGGVTAVVDSGLARVPRFDPNAALTRLDTVRISRASAEQRRGRAGRVQPGICIRLWSTAEHDRLAKFAPPEVAAADLAPLLLQTAAWGASDPDTLAFPDPLPAGALAQARELLEGLGALHADGRLSAMGRQLAALPLHPRLGAMLLAAGDDAERALACRVASLIEEGLPWRHGAGRQHADIEAALEAMDATPPHAHVDDARMRRIGRTERALRRVAGPGTPVRPADASAAGTLLLHGFPDRVAIARSARRGEFLMSNGRAAVLPAGDSLAAAACLVVVDASGERSAARIRVAARTSIESVSGVLRARIETDDLVHWDPRAQAVVAERQSRLGRVVLTARPLSDPDPEQMRAAMLEGLRALGVQVLPWTEPLRQWQLRIALMRTHEPDGGWPDMADAALEADIGAWLAPFLTGCSRIAHLDRVPLAAALATRLPGALRARLDADAPVQLTVPSGRTLRLVYAAEGPPVLAVPLQEMFGATQTPCVARGRIAVRLHLLSPAGRPLQVTQDLPAFWANGYGDVRKQMRGRYPKHAWPEDPLTAVPQRGPKRRSRR